MKRCLMALLMLFSINAFAEVSRWVDENNRVHYSDLPPPAAKAKKLHTTSGGKDMADAGGISATSAPAESKTIAEREAELKKTQLAKKEAADKATKEQARLAANKENCTNAQQSLKALQSGVRMMEIDANDERTYLDDEQRQQRIIKTQQDISRLCI